MLNATSSFSFILFGASGHLAKLKLYPALYTLALKKRLPKDYAIVGFARSAMDDASFRTLVAESVKTDMGEVNTKVLEEMLTHTYYHTGQYDKVEDYKALEKKLTALEKNWEEPVRLAYLSIPPPVFPAVLDNLCAGGIHEKGKNFRCIVEKPVGHDTKTFEEVRAKLMSCFTEKEIYLLDHYLGKEAVRNVYYLRFANPILERILKNTLIHHVEVVASEAGGLEGRAGYFENVGALRDMVQSHLMMMSSLLTMRLLSGQESIPNGRFNALEQFYLPPAASLDDVIMRGQYGSGTDGKKTLPGYREEQGVGPDSRTETFVAMKLLSRTSRWQGVPFYLKTGKRLGKKETRISLQFQVPHTVGQGSSPNRLDIILQGEAGMKMHMQTKLGGTEPTFRPLIMEDPLVCVGDCLPEHGLLLLEAIHGKQDWFLTFDEVRTAWRLIEPLLAHFDNPTTPIATYAAGSHGPTEADAWIGKDGIAWLG